MKRRYIVHPRRPRTAWFDDEDDMVYVSTPQSLLVYLKDDEPQETGLLDAQGNELFRDDERDPIGFLNGIKHA